MPGYLWSGDGVNWTRSPEYPVLTSTPGDHIEDSIDPYVDGNRFRFVYGQYDITRILPLRGKGEAWMTREEPPVEEPPGTTSLFSVAASPDDGDVERGSGSYPRPAMRRPT